MIFKARAALIGIATLALLASPTLAQTVAGSRVPSAVPPADPTRVAGARLGGEGSKPIGGTGSGKPFAAPAPAPRATPSATSSFRALADAIDREATPSATSRLRALSDAIDREAAPN